MRKAKIVCTLGPATSSYEQIRTLIDAGMNVARMNLSHGTYADHEAVYANIRRASEDLGKNVAVLVDLQGPKIRLGNFADGKHDLEVGDTFVITTEDVEGTKERVSTTFKGLPGDCRPGDVLLIDDGKVSVRVTEVTDTDVRTVVEVPGPVSDHKGINLPGVAVSVPAMSDKDEADLRWGLALGCDLIALSFVRDAHDMDEVLRIMQEEGRRVPVIAKIEKPQAVRALRAIVGAFDGIMVARGDLGVELPLEQVPLVQKRAIELARRNAKPVIVARARPAPRPPTARTRSSTAPMRSCSRARPVWVPIRSRPCAPWPASSPTRRRTAPTASTRSAPSRTPAAGRSPARQRRSVPSCPRSTW
jgi:pyruvate kinase